MPCIDVPTPAVPTLPAPFSIPALPAPPPVSVGACCQSVVLAVVPPPVVLVPGAVNPAVIAAINTALHAVQDYIDALPLTCPRNS